MGSLLTIVLIVAAFGAGLGILERAWFKGRDIPPIQVGPPSNDDGYGELWN